MWVSYGSGEKVLGSGYVLKVEPHGFADRSVMGWRGRVKSAMPPGFLTGKVALPCTEM